jgi:hypothetical protein
MSRKSDAAEIQLKRSRLIATDGKATFELTTYGFLVAADIGPQGTDAVLMCVA